MPLYVKTAERCRHLCKYFKRLWLESLVGKAEAALRGQPRLKLALTESLPFLTLSEQGCNHKTTIFKVPTSKHKPAR